MQQAEIVALIRHHAVKLTNTYPQSEIDARECALGIDATCERIKALAGQLYQTAKPPTAR